MMSLRAKREAAGRVDVIIGVLLGILVVGVVVPYVVNNVIHPRHYGSSRTQIINNLKQIALALHSFNDVHRRLPPAFDAFGGVNYPASLHVHLLPFVEQDPLYRKFLSQGWGPENAVIPTYLAPIDESIGDGKGVQNFGANLRIFAEKGLQTAYDANLPALNAVEPGTARFAKTGGTFTDGTSDTIVFATRYATCGYGGSRYAAAPDTLFAAFIGQNAAEVSSARSDVRGTFLLAPSPRACSPTPLMAHSFATGGVQVGLGDGSVRTVAPSVSAETWNRAMHPSDGNVLATDWD